jgi:DNA replication and repair protein RecF
MPIRRLAITDLRNIRAARLEGLPKVTIFYGDNGSGKTSVLEAVHLLGMGRSFRSTKLQPIVNFDADVFTVFGVMEDAPGGNQVNIGIRRSRSGESLNKIQGQLVRSAAHLAERLPLQLINADSFAILVGGPRQRRQFIDAGVFHVEHRFHEVWLQAQRCLKQRNSLLRRDKIDDRQVSAWSAELAGFGEELNEQRERYFSAFLPVFEETLARLATIDGLGLGFYRGWEAGKNLEQVLRDGYPADRKQGFTHSGPHRADIRVKVNGVNAAEVLSRGQQKIVVCAMKIAQGRLLAEMSGKTTVFLVDDLPAELDSQYRQAMCCLLEEMKCQVFVTCVDRDDLAGCWQEVEDIAMFHVEHGSLSPAEPIISH